MLNLLVILLNAAAIISIAAGTYLWALHSGWRDRTALRRGNVSRSPYHLPLQAAIFLALAFGWARHLLAGMERGFDTFDGVLLTGMLFCLVIVAARLVARMRER